MIEREDGNLEFDDDIPRLEYLRRIARAKESVAAQKALVQQAEKQADATEKTWRNAMVRQLLQTQAMTPSPACVAALGDEKQSIERIRYEVLANRSELIEAFGNYGVELKIFKALKDRPGLLAACRVKGNGQKGRRAEPIFCPFEVINWLVKTGVKEKPQLENFMGWHILETKFQSVYAEKSIGDPRQN